MDADRSLHGVESRPAFANLLRNLGSGVLRIGGSSQDQVPFDASAADSDGCVTPHDLARVRETLNLVNSSDRVRRGLGDGAGNRDGTVHVGVSVADGRSCRRRSSATGSAGLRRRRGPPGRRGHRARKRAGPDLLRLTWPAISATSRPTPAPGPSTSGPAWCPRAARTSGPGRASGTARSIPDGSGTGPRSSTRVAPTVKDNRARSGPSRPTTSIRWRAPASTDPYRCPTIERLLSRERMDNFDYQVYTARHRGGPSRPPLSDGRDEHRRRARGAGSQRRRGERHLDTRHAVQRGVPATTRSARRERRLPCGRHRRERPQRRGAGVLLPAGRQRLLQRDPLRPDARGRSADPGPSYYALLLFARLAQGTTGLRPVALDATAPACRSRPGKCARRAQTGACS